MEKENLNRPIIHCFMLVSLDGRVTGNFLFSKQCQPFIDAFMKMDPAYNADGFICGKTTIEESYTKDVKIDLTPFKDHKISNTEDFIIKPDPSWKKYYAISFDRKGNVQWGENHLPGNANKKVLEVLTEKAPIEYLAYLRYMKIPYIICGKEDIDIKLALEKLYKNFDIKLIMLEGGSIINGIFAKEDLVDEITLITAPITGETKDKPLFYESIMKNFKLESYENMKEGGLLTHYIRDDNKIERPYIVCHMLTSIDGKVTGKFLSELKCDKFCKFYYKIHSNYNADGFICGKNTMIEGFTEGFKPDLSPFKDKKFDRNDFVAKKDYKSFGICFDRKGTVGWKSGVTVDDIPEYNNIHIIEVLTEEVGDDYLGYLQSIGVSYIFGGKNEISIKLSLEKLYKLFGIKFLLLEGGSLINGSFMKEKCIDEISLVSCPIVAESNDKPLFFESVMEQYKLISTEYFMDGCLWIKYKHI